MTWEMALARRGPLARAANRVMDLLTRADDGQLVARTLSGNTDAYGELGRRHPETVYNAAYRLVGNRHDALDLTQDAFFRAYYALASYDPTRPFAPWIHTIVTNLALNYLERTHPQLPLDEIERQ